MRDDLGGCILGSAPPVSSTANSAAPQRGSQTKVPNPRIALHEIYILEPTSWDKVSAEPSDK